MSEVTHSTNLISLLELARSAAIAYSTNPRGREFNWYPLWNVFLLMLTQNITKQTIVAPQFPIWLLAEKNIPAKNDGIPSVSDRNPSSDDELDGLGPVDEVDIFFNSLGLPAGSRRTASGRQDSDEQMDDGPGDWQAGTSFNSADTGMESESDELNDFKDPAERSFSSTSTEHRKSNQRVTDFALITWNSYILREQIMVSGADRENNINEVGVRDKEQGKEGNAPPHRDLVHAQISEVVPLLVEIKRAPSRKLSKQKWCKALDDSMVVAMSEVVEQACIFFKSESWKRQDYVMLIAAVGDYWQYAEMHRKLAEKITARENNPKWIGIVYKLSESLGWSKLMRIGSSSSMRAEEEVVEWINDLIGKDPYNNSVNEE